jgi:copper(I)-binding protein
MFSKRSNLRVGTCVFLFFALVGGVGGVFAQRGAAPKARDAWVKLPAAGQTATIAFGAIENPGMYDVYLVSAASDVAEKVELRNGGQPQALDEVTVEAHGTLYLSADGPHLVLTGLKKPLAEGDAVTITVTTELGLKIPLEATVRKE